MDFNQNIFFAISALTANSFQAVISRDSFCAPEVDIFLAALNWVRANPDATSEERGCILGAVRLPLMSTQVKLFDFWHHSIRDAHIWILKLNLRCL